MFNELVKYDFINTINGDNLKALYIGLFNRTEEYESFINKDVATLNLSEIIECCVLMVKNDNVFINATSLRAKIYRLGAYSKWYKEKFPEHPAGCYTELRTEDYNMILSNTQKDLTELDVKDFTKHLNYNQDKFLISAPFYGLGSRDITDILYLKCSDFDFNTNTVRLQTNDCLELPEYVMEFAKGKADVTLQSDSYFITKVWKGVGQPFTKNSIYRLYTGRLRKELGYDKLSLPVLIQFGLRNEIKKIAIENIGKMSVPQLYESGALDDVLKKYHKDKNNAYRLLMDFGTFTDIDKN